MYFIGIVAVGLRRVNLVGYRLESSLEGCILDGRDVFWKGRVQGGDASEVGYA